MSDERYGAIRQSLEEEKVSVEHQLREQGVEPGDDTIEVKVDEGFADSAQATTERSEFIALVEQLRSHHQDVTAALERLEAGTYGKCEKCGNEIPIERLEAIPATNLCVSCKQQSAS